MYQEFLEWVADLVKTLNEFEKRHENDNPILVPMIKNVPLEMEGELVGFLVDEIGGVWSFREPTTREREVPEP